MGGRNARGGLSACKRSPFSAQKAAFGKAKGYLLQHTDNEDATQAATMSADKCGRARAKTAPN